MTRPAKKPVADWLADDAPDIEEAALILAGGLLAHSLGLGDQQQLARYILDMKPTIKGAEPELF